MNLAELQKFKLTDAINFHKDLNPQLFIDDILRDEVRDQLYKIANSFREFIGVTNIALIDITISGSNAAYTYTPHSDIDLHLVVDFDELSNDEVYRELFDAKKNDFNIKHDIKVRSYDVEVYVQDIKQHHSSLGEYSIVKNDWNRIPTKQRASLDDAGTKIKYEKLRELIVLALASGDEEYVNTIAKLINRYRKAGLSEKGEFSPENLAFKVLRNQGYIKKLHDKKNDHFDHSLSLEDTEDQLSGGELLEEFNKFVPFKKKIITEANRGSVILVDFQPDYHSQDHGYESALTTAIEYINKRRPKVMVFFNGKEVGMNDNVSSVIDHYLEYGLNEELIGNITWREKTYAWVRGWMDEGVDTAVIIRTLRYMVMNDLADAREIDEETLSKIFGENPEDWEEYTYYTEDLGLYLPHEISIADLKAMSGSLMGGGFRSECLAELQILMNAFNIKYKLVNNWIYG